MGVTSWRGQIDRALRAIEHIGESKYQAKREQGWQPGQAVAGLYSHGYLRADSASLTMLVVAEPPVHG